MSFNRQLLKKSNDLLAREDHSLPPYENGGISILPDGIHPRYQWFWSEELLSATPLFNSDGTYKMEYLCGCGKDRIVHDPSCKTLTVACVMFTQFKTDPLLNCRGNSNCFALCHWTPPPSPKSWEALYGSFRYYPNQGRYIPISQHVPGETKSHYISVPYPHVPQPGTTERIIHMIRDHHAKSAQRLEDMDRYLSLREMTKTRDITPPPNSQWSNINDRLKDKLTLTGDLPGEKGSASRFSAPSTNPSSTLGEMPRITLAS